MAIYCTIKWRDQDDILACADTVAVDTTKDHIGDTLLPFGAYLTGVPLYFFTGDVDIGNSRPHATLVDNEDYGSNFYIAYSPDNGQGGLTGLALSMLSDLDGDGQADPLIAPLEDPGITEGAPLTPYPYAIYAILPPEYFANVGIDINGIAGVVVTDPIFLPLYIAGDTLEESEDAACCEIEANGIPLVQTIKLQGWPGDQQGNICVEDSDCPAGYSCIGGECVEDPPGGDQQGNICVDDDDCPPGYSCIGGECVEDPPGGDQQGNVCVDDDDCPPGYTCVVGVCLNNWGNPPSVDGCDPTITITGANPLTIETGSDPAYIDDGATAIGSTCQNITQAVVASASSEVNISVSGTYYIHYNVVDPISGISADQQSRTVHIVTPDGMYISDPEAEVSGDTYSYDSNFGGEDEKFVAFTVESRPDELDTEIDITGVSCTPVAPYRVAHKWIRHFDAINDLIKNNVDFQSFFNGLDASERLDVKRYLDDLVYVWALETLRNGTFASNNDIGQWISSAVELTRSSAGGAKELIKMLSPAGLFRNFDDLYCGPPAYISIRSVTNKSTITGYPSISVEFEHHIPAGAATDTGITSTRHINWRLETAGDWGPQTIVGHADEVGAGPGEMLGDGDIVTVDIDLSLDDLGAYSSGYDITTLLSHRDEIGNLGKYIIKAALMNSDNSIWEEGDGLTVIASSGIIEIGDPIESMAVYPLTPASGAPTAAMNLVQFTAMAQYSWRAEMVDAGIPDRLKVDVSDSVLWNILPGTEGDDQTAPNATVNGSGQINIIDIGGDGTIGVVAAWTGRDDDYTNTSSTVTKIREVTIFGDGWDEGPDIIDFATDLLDDLSPVPYSFTVRTHYDTETHHMTETDYTWTVSASTIGGTPVVVEFSEWSEITDNTSKFHFTIPVSTGAGTGEDIVITVQTEHDSGVVVAEGGVASNVVDTYQITVTPVPVAGSLQLQLVEVLPGYSGADYPSIYDEDADNIYLPDSRLITNSVAWGLTDLLEGPGLPATPEMVNLIERGGGSIGEGQTLNMPSPARLIKWATHYTDVNMDLVFGDTPETNSVAWSALVNNSAQPWALMPNTPPVNVPEVCTICVCDYYRFKALVGFGVDNVPDYIEVGGLDKTTVGGYEHEIELYILAAGGPDGTAYPVNDAALSGLSVDGTPMIEIHSSDSGPLSGDDFNVPGTAIVEAGSWVYFKFTNDALGWTFRLAASIKDHADALAPQNSFPVVSANTSYGGTEDDELAITLYVDPCTSAQLRWDYYDLASNWSKTHDYPDGTWHNTEAWHDVVALIQPIIYTEKVGSVMHDAGYTVAGDEEEMGVYNALNTLCIRCPDTWKFLNLIHWFDQDPCNISPDEAMPTITYEVILDPATPIDELDYNTYNTYKNVPFINYKDTSPGAMESFDIEPPMYPPPLVAPISPEEADDLCLGAAGPEGVYCGGYSYVDDGAIYPGYRQAVVAVADSPDKTIADIDLNHPLWDLWIEEHTHTGDGSPLSDRIGVKVVTANTPGVYYIRAMINGDVSTATSWAAYRYVDCPTDLDLPGIYDTECVEYLDSIDGGHTSSFTPGADIGVNVSVPVINWASGINMSIHGGVHFTFKNAIRWYVDGVHLPGFDGDWVPTITFPTTDIDWAGSSNYTVECRIDTAGNATDTQPDGVLDIADLQDPPGGKASTFMPGMNFRLAQTGDKLLCPEGIGTVISADVAKTFTRPANNCEGCDGELALDETGCCPDETVLALTEGCGCDDSGMVIYSADDAFLNDGTLISGDGCCPPLAIDDCGDCSHPDDPDGWNGSCRECIDPGANNTASAAFIAMFNVDCAGVRGGDDYSCCEYTCMIDADCPPHAACCREGGELLGSPLPNYCAECPTDEELQSCLFAWIEFLLADEAGSGLFTGAIPPAYAAEGLGTVRGKLETGVYTTSEVNAAFQVQCETNPDCSWVNWGGDSIGDNCGCLCGGGWDPGGGFGGGLGGGEGGVDPGDGFGGGGGDPGWEFESDKDLKNIIREIPVEEQTKDYHLLGLKVYEYEWLPIAKTLYGVEGHVAEGVLAEDVESTFPALGKPDGDPDDGDLWWHDYPLEPESGWGEFTGKVHLYYNHVNFTLLHQMIEEAKK